ncbi:MULTISPECIES: hypothetical protein [unclassified Pseudomonas]|uniref:hypothetical protein n=1 Tax=unclassified Pseudomonas TaxID=196821 RepID=UPI0035C13451
MNRNLLATALLGAIVALLSGCFDRDDDHPAKDADPSKASLQMQQPKPPETHSSPGTEPRDQ